MDFAKYDPLKNANRVEEATGQAMTCGIDVMKDRKVVHPAWMSSAPIILLIEYMGKHPKHGTTLYESGGKVGLKFKPGINGADLRNGRGQIAINMFGLLQNAADDLRAMIIDRVEIPMLTRYKATSPAKRQETEAAGPSQRS